MIGQDIIAIGASAGGVQALKTIVSGLPAGFPATVFVVLHIGNRESNLPEILSRAGPLPAVHPSNDDAITKGTIYVAPPDCHLLVHDERIRLSGGAKENRTRPAINPLFRSVAAEYGPRVTGVVLTGALDDGTAGLAEIKRKGGTAVVEDPQTAFCSSMPQSALHHVNVDHVASADEIPGLLTNLVNGRESETTMLDEPLNKELSGLTCPECRGPLWEERQGRIVEYRCRVGHAYSPLSLASEHNDTVERTLWSSLVALEEAADIADHLATPRNKIAEDAAKKRRQIDIIKRMLTEAKIPSK